MAVNKVIANGSVLIDLTEDTVSAGSLKKGVTAHDRSGELITGTMEESSLDDVDQVLLYGFQEGTRSFAEDGTVTATDSQGRKLVRVFSEGGRVCTSDLSDKSGYCLGIMRKVYNEDFSEVAIADRHGNVKVKKISYSGSQVDVTVE